MQCRICSNKENNTTYEAREMMLGLRDLHTYFQCGSCGCLQIANVPENIQEYYPSDDYYSYDEIKTETGLKKKLITLRDRYAATGDPAGVWRVNSSIHNSTGTGRHSVSIQSSQVSIL